MARFTSLAALLLCAGLAAQVGLADAVFFEGAVGDWFDPANWTGGVISTIDQSATVLGHAQLGGGTAQASGLWLGVPTGQAAPASGLLTQIGGAMQVAQQIEIAGPADVPSIYSLIGGTLSAERIMIGRDLGSGELRQQGGVVQTRTLTMGDMRFGSALEDSGMGLYALGGGALHVEGDESVGVIGRGRFVQTGGEHVVGGTLQIGGVKEWDPIVFFPPYPDGDAQAAELINPIAIPILYGQGEYELSGGSLSAKQVVVAQSGTFFHAAGQLNVVHLAINPGGQFAFTGGELEITAGLDLDGTLDLEGRSVALSGGGLMNFSRGTLAGTQNASLTVGPRSLTIFAAGYDQAAEWGAFASEGLVHYAGSDLLIDAADGVDGWGTIDDFVTCRGELLAVDGGSIDLRGGLFVDGGTVDLGLGMLTANDVRSGIADGQLQAGEINVSPDRFILLEPQSLPIVMEPAEFSQTGGDVTTDGLRVRNGSYTIADGTLDADWIIVGDQWGFGGGPSVMWQDGGSVSADSLRVGSVMPAFITNVGPLAAAPADLIVLPDPPIEIEPNESIYYMNGGELTLDYMVLEAYSSASGAFIQSGGAVAVESSVAVRDNGRLEIRAGDFRAGVLGDRTASIMGGQIAILGDAQAARVSLTNAWALNKGTQLEIAPGAAVRFVSPTALDSSLLPPATFCNYGTNPQDMTDLANLTLIFEQGDSVVSTFEVAGRDLGNVAAGFEGNFALGSLVIGGEQAGRVQLVDLIDNAASWEGAEALYLDSLTILAGSTLDLNGLNLYCRQYDLGIGATVMGGQITIVPEPATVSLLVLGGALLLRRRR